MFYVSEIQKSAPSEFKTELQEKVYRTLTELQIPFERVDTDVAITMEDCVAINKKLNMKMVKTLFLFAPSNSAQQWIFPVYLSLRLNCWSQCSELKLVRQRYSVLS